MHAVSRQYKERTARSIFRSFVCDSLPEAVWKCKNTLADQIQIRKRKNAVHVWFVIARSTSGTQMYRRVGDASSIGYHRRIANSRVLTLYTSLVASGFLCAFR